MPNLENQQVSDRELLEKIYISVEKTRKYFLWTLIATLVTFLIPLIIMLFLLPSFIHQFSSVYGSI